MVVYSIRALCSSMLCPPSMEPSQAFPLLDGRAYTVGRSRSTCDIVFQDARVSRRHCQLYVNPSGPSRGLYLVHQGAGEILPPVSEKAPLSVPRPSLNGIYVDGRRLGPSECVCLPPGAVVSLVGPTKGLQSTDPAIPHPIGFVVVAELDPSVLLSPEKRIDARLAVTNPVLATNLPVSNGIDCIRIGPESVATELAKKRRKPCSDRNGGHHSIENEETEAPEDGYERVEKGEENTLDSALPSMLVGKYAALTAIASEKDKVNTARETLLSPEKIELSSNGLVCDPLRPTGESSAAALCCTHPSETSCVPTLALQREQGGFPCLLNAYPILVSNGIDCMQVGSESIAIEPARKRHKPCGLNGGHRSVENEETEALEDGCKRVDGGGEENTFTFNSRLNHSLQPMLVGKFATLTAAIASEKDEDNTAREGLPSPEKIELSSSDLECNPLRPRGELSGAALCAHFSESSSIPTLALPREQRDFPRLLNAYPIPASNGIDCTRIGSEGIAIEPISKRHMPCDRYRGHHSVENEETEAPEDGCKRVDRGGEENALDSRLHLSLQSISAGKQIGRFSGSTQYTDGEMTLRRGFFSLSEKLLASSLDLIESSIKLRTLVSNKVLSAGNSYLISSANASEISEKPATSSVRLGSKDRQSLAYHIACSSGELSESIGTAQGGGNLSESSSMAKDPMGQCPPAADNSSRMVDCGNAVESLDLGQASCLSLHWKHGTDNNFEGSDRALDAHDKAYDRSVSEIHRKHGIDENFEGSDRALDGHNKVYDRSVSEIHRKRGIDKNFEGSDRNLDARNKAYDRSGSEIYLKHGINKEFEGSDGTLDAYDKAYDRSVSEIHWKHGIDKNFERSDRTLGAHNKAYEKSGSKIHWKHGIDKNIEGSDRPLDAPDKAYERLGSDENFEGYDKTLDTHDKAYERSSSEVHCKHGMDKNFEGSNRTLDANDKAHEKSGSKIYWKHGIDKNFEGSDRTLDVHNKAYSRSGSEIHWKHEIDKNFEGSDRTLGARDKAHEKSSSKIHWKHGIDKNFEGSDGTLDAHDKAYVRLGSEIHWKRGIDKKFEGCDRTLDAHDKAYDRSGSEIHREHGIDKIFEGSDRTLSAHNKAYERSSSEILGLMLRKPCKISADLVESTSCNVVNEGRRRSTGIGEEESMLGRKEESTGKNLYARGWKPKTKLPNTQLFRKISAGMMRITSNKHDSSSGSPCQMKEPLARTSLDLGLREGNDGNNKPTCDILLCHHPPSNPPSLGSTEEAALRKHSTSSNCNMEDKCELEAIVSRSEGQLLSHDGGRKVVEVIAIEDGGKDEMQIISVNSLKYNISNNNNNNDNNNNRMCFETLDSLIYEATEMQGKNSPCVALADEMHVGRGVPPNIGIDKEDTIPQTRKETSREGESLCEGNRDNNVSESSRGNLLSCTESLLQINDAILDDKEGRQLLNADEKEINCNIGEVNGPEMSVLREHIMKDAIITLNSSRGSAIRIQCAIDCRNTEFNKLKLGQSATQEDRQSTHNEHNEYSPNVEEESFLVAKAGGSDFDQIKHTTAHEFHDILGKHEQVYHTEDIRMLIEEHPPKEEMDLPESDKKGTPQSTFDSRQTEPNKVNPDGDGSQGHKTSSCSMKNDHSSSGKEEVSKGIKSDHYSSRSQDCGNKLDIGNPHVFGIHLNQLQHDEFNSSTDLANVSLQQLLSPMEDLIAVFAATFTSDISWFLSSTEFPQDTPLTVACHNSERCWSASPADRWEKPSSDRPNLTLVYPPFPYISTSGKVSKSRGIGCHHPKFFLLRRKNGMRVIITSANLNSRQWLEVTNTVWWQDFPHRSSPKFRSLFKAEQGCCKGSRGDFASCLAGFLSALLVDVPSEAHWVADLAKYDFTKAAGSLVASIPGLHHSPYSNIPECLMNVEKESFTGLEDSDNSRFWHSNYLGVVATTVVGITHRFQASADPKGLRLRGLAAILSEIGSASGTAVPVLLKRARHITADPNAVSVLITLRAKCGSHELFLQDDISHTSGDTMDSLQLFDQGCIQLGFLPKNIASWLAPLCDGGFFSYAACICPKEALSIASEQVVGSVKLGLYVFEGPKFSALSSVEIGEGIYEAISSLLKSLHRPYGLWRLQQILSKYKWPDEAETDFLFSSSSIGTSLDAPFLGAFSAAAGRRIIPLVSSADSDPEWGCWTAECEAERPSIGIVFPTIERVKKDIASQYALLCFAERTWERLKSANLLHDAVPFPREREGYPMHIKVGRRRFQSSPDAIPCGWVYTGSHNFSPAAWGRPIWKAEHGRAATSAGPILGSALHIFNYELGIVFVEPPDQHSSGKRYHKEDMTKLSGRRGIDKYNLPFVVPAPKYKPTDRPATGRALHEAYLEQQALLFKAMVDEDEMPSEAPVEMELDAEEQNNNMQEVVESNAKAQEAYAVVLWSQIGDVD